MKNSILKNYRVDPDIFSGFLIFLKLSVIIAFAFMSCQRSPSLGDVWTFDLPGGSEYSSPDYTVRVEQNGVSHSPWVHHNFALDTYTRYNSRGESTSIMRKNVGWTGSIQELGIGTVSHSAAIFSFSGTITVRVTVNPDAGHITLPLTSAKVLPSSYDIPCYIENGNTIVFTLDRPEKIAIIANYDKVWKIFKDMAKGHVPIQSHLYRDDYDRSDFHGRDMLKALSEGYKNPLFVIALPPEKNVPDKYSPETLVVNPEDKPTQEQLNNYKTIWFSPGIHDLTYMGDFPTHRTFINAGQRVYLEGGSLVKACFWKNLESGTGETSITGRGMISGMSPNHRWMLETVHVNHIDTVIGVTVIDRAGRGIHNVRHMEDVTMLGAWHGNNNGVHEIDNSTIKNCFLMCHDDNLKIGDNTHARHIVLWQGPNAHPIMAYEYGGVSRGTPTKVELTTWSNTLVEDVDIIMYGANAERRAPWHRHTGSAIAINLGRINMEVNNFTFRDIRIESPFLFRVFTIYNIDSSKDYAASWFKTDFFYTSEENHTRINGLTLENISVNSPVILYRSILGSDYYNSLNDVKFTNLNINGTIVTDQNKDEFFEITDDKINGLTFQ
jgi:hypothetical protein